MSHAHRKNSVTVPLGGLNATNQNFAKSLRFNNKSENEKDEWHDQLLAEDSNATVNSKNFIPAQKDIAESANGMVTTQHFLATKVGEDILYKGLLEHQYHQLNVDRD